MKRLILCSIAVLLSFSLAFAEITFTLKDGSKVTWESYTETQTHYCKGSTANCIDKANVDAIREVIGGKNDNKTQKEKDLEADKIMSERYQRGFDELNELKNKAIILLGTDASVNLPLFCSNLNGILRQMDTIIFAMKDRIHNLEEKAKKKLNSHVDELQAWKTNVNIRTMQLCK
jgi:hypothetical protein